MNKRIINWIDKKFYPEYEDNWDNKLLRETILPYLNKEFILLDIGAGAGIVSEMNFRGLVKRVIGIDPDERVMKNEYLDNAFIAKGENLEVIRDSSIDLAICNNVLEHIDNPLGFFKEIRRILKPSGLCITKTPNKYHYVPFFAKISPNWFHVFYNKLRGRKETDTYPTVYKVNTIKAQKYVASQTGLIITKLVTFEGRPEYLRTFCPFYLLGLIYERIVNFFHLSGFKVIIISIFKKG